MYIMSKLFGQYATHKIYKFDIFDNDVTDKLTDILVIGSDQKEKENYTFVSCSLSKKKYTLVELLAKYLGLVWSPC